MATENQLDFLRRLMRTHEVREADVAAVVGPIEALSEDRARAVICAIADGEFGGISGGGRPKERLSTRQQAKIFRLAYEVVAPPLFQNAGIFVRQIYPDVQYIYLLNARQAARVIVELDRTLTDGRRSYVESAETDVQAEG